MIWVRLLEQWSIPNPINTYQIGPIQSTTHAQTHPQPIVKDYNFFTRQGYELDNLYGFDNGIFYKYMCINSTSIQHTHIYAWSNCLKPLKQKNNSYEVSYFSIKQWWARTWNNVFIWTFFLFPSTISLIIWSKIDLGPFWAYNIIFFKWAQYFAKYFPPFPP